MTRLDVLKQTVDELLERNNFDVAIYIETNEGTLSVNPHQVFSSASLIKVPILLTALREAEKGHLQLNEAVKGGTFVGGAGVLSTLSRHSSFTWEDILTLMVIVSDNSATNWVIERLGVNAIKRLIESVGCERTSLNRKMMDVHAIANGLNNFTTAYDMVQFLKFMRDKQHWAKESFIIMDRIMATQQFTLLTAELEEEDHPKISYGSKSGSLQGLQHDCAYFHHEDKYIYAAVLTADLPHQLMGKRLIGEIGMALKDYIL